VSFRPVVESIRTEDQNGDGRPDVWRHYDARGELTRVDIDTNFDGRADRQEYYQSGALVRRELDRNFDDRVDLVEDFDAVSHEHVRSVLDVDFDGAADLLVLFQDGRPVFSETALARTATRARETGRRSSGDLAALFDPFRGDLAVRSVGRPVGAEASCVLASVSGLPADRAGPSATIIALRTPRLAERAIPPSVSTAPRLTRGPPSSLL